MIKLKVCTKNNSAVVKNDRFRSFLDEILEDRAFINSIDKSLEPYFYTFIISSLISSAYKEELTEKELNFDMIRDILFSNFFNVPFLYNIVEFLRKQDREVTVDFLSDFFEEEEEVPNWLTVDIMVELGYEEFFPSLFKII